MKGILWMALVMVVGSSLAQTPVPPKATPEEVAAGVDNYKYITAKGLADAGLGPSTNGLTPQQVTNAAQASIGVGASGIATITTNSAGNFTVNVTAANVGAVTSSNALVSVIATNAHHATNVYYGGTVTTTNVSTKIANSVMTNANVFVGYGGIQMAATWALQESSGIANSNHVGSKISWYQTGWDGTPQSPTQFPVVVPQAFIDVRRNWGGGPLNTGNDRPTFHLATKGDIRIEPFYSAFAEPDSAIWFGQQYLSLGNEDAGNRMYINYLNGSIRGGYAPSGTPSERWQASTNLAWAKGYGLPLEFLAVGIANNTEYHSNPSIWAWSGDTNAADKRLGELWFNSKSGTFDIWQPTIDVFQTTENKTVTVFKMRTNHVEFLLGGIKTDTIAPVAGSQITITTNIAVGGITATGNVSMVAYTVTISPSQIRFGHDHDNVATITANTTKVQEFFAPTYGDANARNAEPFSWLADSTRNMLNLGGYPANQGATRIYFLGSPSLGAAANYFAELRPPSGSTPGDFSPLVSEHLSLGMNSILGNVRATNFVGNGAALTNLSTASQIGTHASPNTTTPLSPAWPTVESMTIYEGVTGTINLPPASEYKNKDALIYNTGAFTVTVDPNGSEVIVRDGTVQTGGVSFTLSSGAGNFVWLICDGVRWITLGYKGTLSEGS